MLSTKSILKEGLRLSGSGALRPWALNNFQQRTSQLLGFNAKRHLRLHEHQGFALFQDYRVPIPLGNIAFTGKEAQFHARTIARETDYKSKFVVKAQVQSSNRSKGQFKENGFFGGIHIADSPEQVKDIADQMCGKTFVTPIIDEFKYYSTGSQGFLNRCVLIQESLQYTHSFYISITLDRERACPVITYSKYGGLHFLNMQQEVPHEIKKIYIDILKNIQIPTILDIASDLGIEEQKSQLTFIIKHLYDMFIEKDAEVVEINPLVLTTDNQLIANHAHIRIDNNSLYRQQELSMKRDYTQLHVKERIALTEQLRYVHLEDGRIGVISNGAGQCMATCDFLQELGQKPANFLDLGGQAYHEKVSSALVLMEKDQDVDSIIINVFCGQLPADKIAMVIKQSYEDKYITKPVICRIKGHRSKIANTILGELNDPRIIIERDLQSSCLIATQKAQEVRAEKDKSDLAMTYGQNKHNFRINPIA